MKKSLIGWLVLSVAVMVGLPWAAITFARGDESMAAVFLLFFAVDPIYSIAVGIFAGRDIRQMWSLPVISAALFMLGTWVFFSMGEWAFLLYAGIYLAIGLAAMLIRAWVGKRKG